MKTNRMKGIKLGMNQTRVFQKMIQMISNWTLRIQSMVSVLYTWYTYSLFLIGVQYM